MSQAAQPYPAYSFVLNLPGPGGPPVAVGGFSEASGLLVFRKQVSGDKITGISKIPDVTLKRGVISSSSLWNWISRARSGGASDPRDLIVTLRDEANNPVQAWKLSNSRPIHYSGPTLGDTPNQIAIEELVLSAESIEIFPPG